MRVERTLGTENISKQNVRAHNIVIFTIYYQRTLFKSLDQVGHHKIHNLHSQKI